jgi:hypothetical protein
MQADQESSSIVRLSAITNETNVSEQQNETRQATIPTTVTVTSSGSKSSPFQNENAAVNTKLSEDLHEISFKELATDVQQNDETTFVPHKNTNKSKVVEPKILSSKIDHLSNQLDLQNEEPEKNVSENEESSSSSDSDSSSSSDDSDSEDENEEIPKNLPQPSTPQASMESEVAIENLPTFLPESFQLEEKNGSQNDKNSSDSGSSSYENESEDVKEEFPKNNSQPIVTPQVRKQSESAEDNDSSSSSSSSDSSSSSSSDEDSDDEAEDEKPISPKMIQCLNYSNSPEVKSEDPIEFQPLEKSEVVNDPSSGDESDEEGATVKPRIVLRIKLDAKQLKVFRQQQLTTQPLPFAKSPEVIQSAKIVKSPEIEPWLLPVSLKDIFIPPPMLSPIRWSDQEPQVFKVLTLLMTF